MAEMQVSLSDILHTSPYSWFFMKLGLNFLYSGFSPFILVLSTRHSRFFCAEKTLFVQKPFMLLPKSTVRILNSLVWRGFPLLKVFSEAENGRYIQGIAGQGLCTNHEWDGTAEEGVWSCLFASISLIAWL